MMQKVELKPKQDIIGIENIHKHTNNTYQIQKCFYGNLKNIENYKKVQQWESECFQHGNTTVFKHSRNVAYMSIRAAHRLEKRFGISFNYNNLLAGAFLHDMFLYDWHEKDASHRLHGFRHPKTASKNAKEICNVNNEVASFIQTHMWPLTITKVPRSREAFMVCMIDKYVALMETIKRK